MSNVPDLLVAGELFVDLILSGFGSWPQPGQEAFAKEFRRDVGGGAAITACGLAKLGSSCRLMGIVGTDTGEWLVNRLIDNGVDTASVVFDSVEPTAFTVAVSTPHDRTFLTYPGANRRLQPLLMEAATARQLTGIRHVHLACAPDIEFAADLFDGFRAQGCTLSIDVGWHEDWLRNQNAFAALKHVDIFFPNEVEARCMTGEEDPAQILDAFSAAGLKRVAVKLGSRGAALLWDGEQLFTGAHPVTPLDTTGAGDCFDAGFLHAWINRESPETCLRTANICGAISTEAYGGIAGFPAPGRLKNELLKGHHICAR